MDREIKTNVQYSLARQEWRPPALVISWASGAQDLPHEHHLPHFGGLHSLQA